MPALRTSQRDQLALAIEDLAEVTAPAAGLAISPVGPDRVTVTMGKHAPWLAAIHPRASLSPREAQALTAAESDERYEHIVVADQVAAEAKEHLTTARWSWLDRRSELRLRHGDTTIEIRLPPGGLHPHPRLRMALAAPASDGPIRGRAGISYAAALLLGPEQPPSIRSVARQIGMAPSTVSEAAAHLRAGGYILANGQPETPDLFDALVAVWRPVHVLPVATRPVPDELERLGPNIDDLDGIGWAQGNDEAALAWGAPMFLSGDQPWIWVPDLPTARRAERELGSATWGDAAGVIAVPPTPLVCMGRRRAPLDTIDWPTPHPLYLALDLARDPGRGREILDGWSPPEPMPYPWTRASAEP